MNLKFGWIHNPLGNSLDTISQNITEYITVELLAKGINVQYFYSVDEALISNLNFYASVGTLFKDDIYKNITNNTKNFNINTSNYVIFDNNSLYNSLSLINRALTHQDYFVNNTERFETTFEDRGTIFDCCICSAGGETATLVSKNVKLTPGAKIYVVDISENSLNRCKELISGNYEFVQLDLFDTTEVEKFVTTINTKNALWFASNIFNYVNTSLIYDNSVRRRKQQDFITLLSKQKTKWFVSMNSVDSVLIKNQPVNDLLYLKENQGLNVLPWVSLNQQSLHR